jgi:hypothetical protein
MCFIFLLKNTLIGKYEIFMLHSGDVKQLKASKTDISIHCIVQVNDKHKISMSEMYVYRIKGKCQPTY